MTSMNPNLIGGLMLGNCHFAVCLEAQIDNKDYNIRFLSNSCESHAEAMKAALIKTAGKKILLMGEMMTLEDPIVSVFLVNKRWVPGLIFSKDIQQATQATFVDMKTAMKVAKEIAGKEKLTFLPQIGLSIAVDPVIKKSKKKEIVFLNADTDKGFSI